MNKVLKSIIIIFELLILTICLVTSAQAALDSKGKDFFITFNANTQAGVGNPQLFISSEKLASGTVSIEGLNFVKSFTVQPNESVKIDIPDPVQRYLTDTVNKLAVRITSDQDVTVYGLNQAYHTTDGFLGLPIDVLGLDHIVLSYEVRFFRSAPSEVLVVAPYDQTEVTITPNYSRRVWGNRDTFADIPFTISLNSGETYAIKSEVDLTGTTITSNKPVGVTSSVDCTHVPIQYIACDHLTETLPPVSTWGKVFLTTPLASRLKGDVFRILASENNTAIKINDVEVAQLNRGEFYEIVLTTRSIIESNKPVLVSQYSTGQEFDGVNSDPFMMLLPPVGQYLDQYTFESLVDSINYDAGYVNVVIPTDSISSLMLDGSIVNASLFQRVAQSDYSAAQIQINEGVHNISASVPFGISVYGYGEYESYGFPGGVAFELINPGGDKYNPFVKLVQVGDVIQGTAGDFEDVNLNGLIDLDEDFNGNNALDRRTEDANGNNQIDTDEDTNGNGILDRDTGIFRIELEQNSENLILNLDPFVKGALKTNFEISLIDPLLPGRGLLIITDGVGNEVQKKISINDKRSFQNVQVISKLSGDNIGLDQTSFLQAPDSIELLSSGAIVKWNFATFDIDQVEDLDYEVMLRNPIPGETRLVTQFLELLYVDVNGNEVRHKLGEQSVDVAVSLFGVEVKTDKPQYTANETVLITPQISNLSGASAVTDVNLFIKTIDGQIVQDFGVISDFEVTANMSRLISGITFETRETLAGSYIVVAELLDKDANITLTDEAPFDIVDSANVATSIRATTDKVLYHTTDSVEISSLVRHVSKNNTIEGATLKVEIINELNEVVYTVEKVLSTLTFDFSNIYINTYSFVGAKEGEYRVVGSIISSQDKLLAQDEAFYSVRQNTIRSLNGNVSLNQSSIKLGESLVCTDVVVNNGNVAINGLQVRQVVVDIQTPAITSSMEQMVNLSSAQPITNVNSISTASFDNTDYACSLQAYINDEWITLDTEYFTVTKEDTATVLLANDDEMFINRGAWGTINVLDNDEIKPSGPVEVNVLTKPQNGNLIDVGNGVFNFFPNIIFKGQESFVYQLKKDGVESLPATVFVDVSPGLSCSFVPDHKIMNSQAVDLKNWAKTTGDPYDPPRYRIEILGNSKNDVFVAGKMPSIDYPACSLSYTVKAGKRAKVTVQYRVKDIRTGGSDYTSRIKTFEINVDTSKESTPSVVIVPILQLLLLDEEK